MSDFSWLSIIAVVSAVVVVVVFAILIWGRKAGWKGVTPPDKTFWDFVYLAGIVMVPLVVVFFATQVSQQLNTQQQQMENERNDLEIQRDKDRKESARADTLQAYLDQMGTLLLEHDLRSSEESSEARTVARARTLEVLEMLDRDRRTRVMRFLLEAELVQRIDGKDAVVGLSGANLSGVGLSRGNLSGADLSCTDPRDSLGDPPSTSLGDSVSTITESLLGGYDAEALTCTNLSDATLFRSILYGADLSGADLSGANLEKAVLSEANLTEATNWTVSQLTAAKSLDGATMPNGQKYEDWLKDREDSGKDGEESNP